MPGPCFRSLALGCAALAAAACTSSHGGVSMGSNSGAVTTAGTGPLSAIGTATNAVVDPIASAFDSTMAAVTSILPYEHEASPEAQRRKMLAQAGTDKFRHEELSAGKDEMTRHREEFRGHRNSFVNPAFAQSRTRWRTGETRPNSGPVLGSAIATTLHDPDVARALLSSIAAGTGVPVVTANPILAQLLPAFGN